MLERIDDDSEFWYTVGLIYNQFLGLMMGYNSVAPQSQVSVYTKWNPHISSHTHIRKNSLFMKSYEVNK